MYPVISQRQGVLRPRPRGFEAGYLLIFLLSLVSIGGASYGMKMLTNLSFLRSLFATSILCIAKMYFLRPQPFLEQAINSGWDRFAGYVVTVFLSISLVALGFYCYGSVEWATIATPAVCSIGNFLGDTLKQEGAALRCWIGSAIVEFLILILALINRSRYRQYYLD